MTHDNASEFVTRDEVCRLLHVSRSTVERMVRKGNLTAYELPTGGVRYKLAEVVAAPRPRVVAGAMT